MIEKTEWNRSKQSLDLIGGGFFSLRVCGFPSSMYFMSKGMYLCSGLVKTARFSGFGLKRLSQSNGAVTALRFSRICFLYASISAISSVMGKDMGKRGNTNDSIINCPDLSGFGEIRYFSP